MMSSFFLMVELVRNVKVSYVICYKYLTTRDNDGYTLCCVYILEA